MFCAVVKCLRQLTLLFIEIFQSTFWPGIQLTSKKLIMKKEKSLSISNAGTIDMMNGFVGTVLIYVP